ncbi:sec4-like phosphatidylinositol transfer-like protein [Trypanosoma grayi]|uniref:sec4-like phosphatidylinositol transfer-like protein n=1 Tax=Trypanosoma grayi TaxID=71804 RepID=UPI0004F4B3D0|nr:sec4-like phosphatidylinositol transfer-like protein [Trypanosoma grayi]KEG09339.1 sec4-like phosphatidylinositol transfer-like protein [Trypanosoma grayi]
MTTQNSMTSCGVPPPTEEEAKCVEWLRQQFPQSVLDAEDVHFFRGNTYLRFARARNANVEKAAAMLKACVEWRREFKPYKITVEDVSEAMEQLTIRVGGRCREGRPLLIMTVGAPNSCDAQARTRQLVYIMEEMLRKGYEQLTWVMDFGEMGKHPRDPRSTESRKLTMQIMQDYYPELLGKMLLYRYPWYVRAMYALVNSFIDKRTRKKIVLVAHEEKLLLQHVESDQLPESLGGTLRISGERTLNELPCHSGDGAYIM